MSNHNFQPCDTSDNEPLRHKKVKASDIDTEGNTVAKSDEPPDKDKEHDVIMLATSFIVASN